MCLVDGEITVLPHRDKLLKLIKDRNWFARVCTNAAIYNDSLAEILSRPLSCLNVSLDAGTSATYKRIKGPDTFYKVVSNIERYAQTNCRIELKYILIPGINDNFDDINGFIDIAQRLKADLVILSNDLSSILEAKKIGSPLPNITEQQFDIYVYFVAQCKKNGLTVGYSSECFSMSDCHRMNNLCTCL